MRKNDTLKYACLASTALMRSCAVGVLLAALALGTAAEALPKHVLVLHSFGREFAPFNTVSEAFRTELGQLMEERVEFHDVALESARYQGEALEGPLLGYLAALFGPRPPDLVVTIGGPAARFAQKHRQRLFPTTPMLIAGTDQRHLQTVALDTNAAVVVVANDMVGIMDSLLQVLPETTHVAVVLGSSPIEKFWLGELQRDFVRFTNRISLEWFSDLSLAQMQKRAAALPPRSAIFYALMSVDAEGVPYAGNRALSQLHAVANAPIFGIHDSQLGLGIVGGPLMNIEELGRNTAKVAVRILQGEPAGSIKTPPQVVGRPVYDWRELQRWGISEQRLPPGSLVRFRQPSFWQLYRWTIAGGAVFVLLQAGLIIVLLLNRLKRRQGEAVATVIASLSSKFINLPGPEVDKAIEEAQRRVCECIGLDVSSLWQWDPQQPDTLVMTHLYRRFPGPVTPARFDAREYFPWALQQLRAGRVVALSLNKVPAEASQDLKSWRHFGLKTVLNLPLIVGGGRPVGLLCFNDTQTDRDWTDALVQPLQLVAQIFANALARKQADQSLRESEARLGLAADAAGAGLWSLNLGTGCYWLTAKTRELFHLRPEEVLTLERFLSFVHAEDRSEVRQTVETMVRTRGEGNIEYRVIGPDGNVRWMSSRGRVHCNAAGQPDHMTGVTVDMTPRRQAEQELLRQREELAHVSRVSVLGELATSLAHELNQPLGAILSNAEAAEMFLAQDPPALEEVRDILADIRKDDERAGEVIRRMRALLRKGELERQPLRLEVLVEEVLRLVAANAAMRTTTLRAELAPDLPLVQGDRIQLQQVLLNLIMNSLEAMSKQPPDKRRLVVRTSCAAEGGVEVSVADSGPGIETADLQRVFDPFFTTKPNGIGMGLAISRKIVEAHQGRIWAENVAEGGTVFRLSLPVRAEGRKT